MKNFILFLAFGLAFQSVLTQSREEILDEAYKLYYSEMTSWNGTDIFLERFPHKREQIGGYLSYEENATYHCIFFDKNPTPYLLAKISFDKDFTLQTVKIDTTHRLFTPLESDLYSIRKKTIETVSQDTMFKQYQNTSINPIPLISKDERKVYILTGPQVSGVVILGNDYLLTFNQNNELISKKALHKNIIPLEYSEDKNGVATMHSHTKTTGKYITPTDICTLMLYGKYTNWRQHYVISKKHVSIWDHQKKGLVIMKKKAWEKIGLQLEKGK